MKRVGSKPEICGELQTQRPKSRGNILQNWFQDCVINCSAVQGRGKKDWVKRASAHTEAEFRKTLRISDA